MKRREIEDVEIDLYVSIVYSIVPIVFEIAGVSEAFGLGFASGCAYLAVQELYSYHRDR